MGLGIRRAFRAVKKAVGSTAGSASGVISGGLKLAKKVSGGASTGGFSGLLKRVAGNSGIHGKLVSVAKKVRKTAGTTGTNSGTLG